MVAGEKEDVDLPRRIVASRYYRNLEKKAAAGDTPVRRLQELNSFITNNPDRVWEHSWVRFPLARLNRHARSVPGGGPAGRQAPAGRTAAQRLRPLRMPPRRPALCARAGQLPAQAGPGRRRRPNRPTGHPARCRNRSAETFSQRQHLTRNLLVLPGPPEPGYGNRTPGGGRNPQAVSAQPPAGAVRQRAVRAGRTRPARHGLLCAAPTHPPKTTQRTDLRFLLPRTVHEPLPVRLGPW